MSSSTETTSNNNPETTSETILVDKIFTEGIKALFVNKKVL